MKHSSGSGYGENLYWTWSSSGTAALAADAGVKATENWYNKEVANFDFRCNKCKDNNFANCGHYTQVLINICTCIVHACHCMSISAHM